jgi:hypothetical protein
MIATGKSNNNLHEVTFDFKAGEKCFCCTKVFNKKTKVVQSFENEEKYQEFISQLKHFWSVDVKTN